MSGIKDKYGLTTDMGTNALAVIASAMGIAQAQPSMQVWMTPICVAAAVAILWLMKGGAGGTAYQDKPDDQADATIDEVLNEGRK